MIVRLAEIIILRVKITIPILKNHLSSAESVHSPEKSHHSPSENAHSPCESAHSPNENDHSRGKVGIRR